MRATPWEDARAGSDTRPLCQLAPRINVSQRHMGDDTRALKLERALDIPVWYETERQMTGRPGGAASSDSCDCVMETLQDPDLEAKWKEFVSG